MVLSVLWEQLLQTAIVGSGDFLFSQPDAGPHSPEQHSPAASMMADAEQPAPVEESAPPDSSILSKMVPTASGHYPGASGRKLSTVLQAYFDSSNVSYQSLWVKSCWNLQIISSSCHRYRWSDVLTICRRTWTALSRLKRITVYNSIRHKIMEAQIQFH